MIILTNKLDGLKITCIGQLLSDGSGVAGSARFKNMINLFKESGMQINLISFSFGVKISILNDKSMKI